MILKMTSGDTTVYALLAATNFFGHATKNIISSMEYEEMLGSLGAGRAYYAQADASVWDVGSGEVAAGELMLPVGTVDNATVTLVWANHDVLEITSLDTSTGDYTTGGVYFAQTADTSTGTGNNDASIYRIRRSRLAGIGDQVRRLTEVSPDLTPEEIEAMLAELDITLEEAYVTPTTEQQEIYPSAYGFSKVIVEAVEDSGTSSGGGTGEGGEGGGTEENYVSSDYVSFGNEYTDIPAVVDDGNKYKVIARRKADGLVLQLSSTGHYYHTPFDSWGTLIYKITTDGIETAYTLDGTWGDGVTWYTAIRDDLWDVLYTSHDIPEGRNGTEIWMEGTEPYSDTVSVRIPTPLERDETYTIDGNKLNDLIGAVQGLTGSDEPMTPDEAIEALGDYGTRPAAEEASF